MLLLQCLDVLGEILETEIVDNGVADGKIKELHFPDNGNHIMQHATSQCSINTNDLCDFRGFLNEISPLKVVMTA